MASEIRKFFYCLSQTCKPKTIGSNVNYILLNAISVGDRLLSAANPSWIPPFTTRQKQAHKYKHSLIDLSADTCPHSGPIPPANPVLSQPAHTPPAGQTSHVPPTITHLTRCQSEREADLLLRPMRSYVPTCDDDGNFTPMQCSASTGYCWCVNIYTGVEIRGTRTPPGKMPPRCGEWRYPLTTL